MSILLEKSRHSQSKGTTVVLLENMRAALAHGASRLRSSSLSTVPPPQHSATYSPEHAAIAATIIYRSPLPSQSGLPIYILNAAAFPDAFEVDYDALLPYVLARLPEEEDLIAGEDYEIIFFAGGQPESATSGKKQGPGLGWYLQAYHALSRALRKRLQMLYVVHERSWVRVLIEVFGTIVSPKFRKKIVHVNTLSGLALYVPIEQLLIPPSVYLHDRRVSQEVYAPYASGRRAFAADEPFPTNSRGEMRLPRVLRETTAFICSGDNVKTEGLFRIPPHSQLMAILREAYDRGQKYIVWREGSATYVQPEIDSASLRELSWGDTYGVHLAAGLIKLWYRELKKPIFEESCYEAVRQCFGNTDQDITVDSLAEMISPASTASFLSRKKRNILALHLVPLLSFVASHHSSNKMTSGNLAICFAPAMVRGQDQLADAKMTSIIRRIIEAAVEAWPNGLRQACNSTPDALLKCVRRPRDPLDYEDPLPETIRPQQSQESGHQAQKSTQARDHQDTHRPPLPPRHASALQADPPSRKDSMSSVQTKKPAPAVPAPPRYSAIANNGGSGMPILANKHSPETEKSRATLPSYKEKATDAAECQSRDAEREGRKGSAVTAPAPAQSRDAEREGRKGSVGTAPAPAQSRGDLMKELKDSLITEGIRRKPVSSPVTTPSLILPAPETVPHSPQYSASADTPIMKEKEGMFTRPTWPASARRVSSPNMTQLHTLPESTAGPGPLNPGSANANLSAPAFKPRTPSPGLLKRMTSMETVKTMDAQRDRQREKEKLLPHKLGLKQASVDDLRRLYEERASTVAKLSVASESRRGSNVSMV